MDSSPSLSPADATPPVKAGASGESVPLPPWDMYTVAVSLFSGYILIPLIVSNVLTLTMPFLRPAMQIVIGQSATFCSWICIFGFLAWRYRRNPLPYMALKSTRPLGYYLKEALYVLIAMLALIILMGWWVKSTGGALDQPYAKFSSNELRVISFFAVVMAPVLEEVVFRGFVQTTFHRVSTPLRSVIFTALLFLLFHGLYFDKLQAMLHVLSLGLLLGYWRERTQSALPGILGHLFNNILASWALFS